MNSEESSDISSATKIQKPVFKKPLLVGKVGKFPKKVVKEDTEQKVEPEDSTQKDLTEISDTREKDAIPKNDDAPEDKQLPLQYKEPSWSGIPESIEKQYKLEVLKSGSIIETINLMEKAFWIFGRLTNCDICMAHPTISRYHAVLQYRSVATDNEPKGFYLYDLSSTHGTFLNKNRLKPRLYIKVYVGHLLKLGLSSRSYLLTGPEDDTEQESDLTVTELKEHRKQELTRREEAKKEATRKREEDKEAMQKKLEERGVDWGLGEDADEESDITENPFAQTNNEELYIDDPKKALRGFMEREGHDLEYDCTEQGIGQFLCKVELPLDDERGRPIVAEVLHKGKKKEAVIQCALEACRILDRYGLLRQATHESRKRKAKNWEENDFYDSDEDTFLDRTGTIEKKRENRMKAKVPNKPETYQTLLEKEVALRKEINNIEKQLYTSNNRPSTTNSSNDEDSLDNYMKELKQMKLDKITINKLKSDLSKLKQDLTNVVKLSTIAKPVDLPKLIKENPKNTPNETKHRNKLPIFGKRLKVKVQIPERKENIKMDVDSGDEEESEDEENPNVESQVEQSCTEETSVPEESTKVIKTKKLVSPSAIKTKENSIDIANKLIGEFLKIDNSFKMIFPLMANESENHLRSIWSKMKSLHPEYSAVLLEEITAKFSNYINSCRFIGVIDNFTKEVDAISALLKSVKTGNEIIVIARKLISLAKEITLTVNRLDQNDGPEGSDQKNQELDESACELDLEKRKKKNQRRIQQRQEKAEIEKQKGYKEDAAKEDYNMWVPPKGQTGDGRTRLNEKYGY